MSTGKARSITDLRALTLALLAGSCALHLLPQLPPLWVYGAGAAIFVLLLPLRRVHWLWLALLLGAAWSHWHAADYLQQRFDPADDGKTVWVTGWVASLPQHEQRRSHFLFQPLGQAAARIRVSDYEHRSIPAGSCQRLKLRLSGPRGSVNPGSFDVTAWAYRKQLAAMAYVRKRAPCTPAQVAQLPWLSTHWLALRARLVARVAAVLQDHPMRGAVLSLTLGAAGAVTQAQWQTLRQTGTTHILSISGFHIAVIAGWIFWLLRWLWPRWPKLALWCPAQRAAAVGALLVAVLYAALAGFSLPTERSLIMAAVVLGAAALGRHLLYTRVLALAVLLVLLHDPAAVMQPGFWLSFMAVAWIAWLMSNRVQKPGRWMTWFGLQLAMAVVLTPVLLHVFGQTSIVSPLANVLMLPLFALLVPLLMLAVVLLWVLPVLGAPLLLLGANVLLWTWWLLQWLGNLPGATAMGSAALMPTVLAVVGLLWLTLPRGAPVRWLGALLCLPLLLAPVLTPPVATVRLTVLDVGQGLAALVRTHTHALLFDTGPAGPGYDSGRDIILPFLRQRHVEALDAIVISHDHRDHTGGLHSILAALPVRQRWGAQGGQPCQAGEQWQWDGVTFRFLYPDAQTHATSANDVSCVLKVSVGGQSVLLTGDIEAAAEADLLARHRQRLPAQVLVVAHHGSCTSSTADFLAAVQPHYALIPVGWHNRYHHPCDPVVARLMATQAQVLSTAGGGALQLQLSAEGVSAPTAWRNQDRHFWRWPVTPVTQLKTTD